jgi:hypothetical protein
MGENYDEGVDDYTLLVITSRSVPSALSALISRDFSATDSTSDIEEFGRIIDDFNKAYPIDQLLQTKQQYINPRNEVPYIHGIHKFHATVFTYLRGIGSTDTQQLTIRLSNNGYNYNNKDLQFNSPLLVDDHLHLGRYRVIAEVYMGEYIEKLIAKTPDVQIKFKYAQKTRRVDIELTKPHEDAFLKFCFENYAPVNLINEEYYTKVGKKKYG